MKRCLILIAVLFFSMPILDSAYTAKIEPSVISTLENNEEVNVIIFLKHPNIVAEFKNEQDRILNKVNYVYYRDRFQGNNDFRLKHKYKTINALSGNITKSGLEKLSSDAGVERIELNKRYVISLAESLPLINATLANSIVMNSMNLTGSTKSICIIDTGINYSHESFGSCTNSSFLSGDCKKILNGTNFYAGNNNILDDQGHGTHVAGIAAANGSVKGVAPDASLLIIKSCFPSGGSASCYEDDLIAGIDWCTLYKGQYNISAISMSIGTDTTYTSETCPTTWNSYINSAIAKNITFVAASGNAGSTSGISHPACAPNVTSIGSTYDSGGSVDTIASYTNRFSNLDLLAPGSTITSTSISGGTVAMSGTSMATPFAAGAIALLNQYYTQDFNAAISQAQIYSSLNSTGKKILDTGTGNTFSRIDIYSAIISLDTKKPGIWDSVKTPSIVLPSTDIIFYSNATDPLLNQVIIELGINTSFTNYTVHEKTGNTYNFTLSSGNLSMNQNISWKFYAIDKNGNMNQTMLQSFVINITSPVVSLDYPFNNSFLQSSSVNFLFTPYDDESNASCSLYLNGIINRTNSSTITNTQSNFSVSLPEGTYSSYVNCSDSQGNSNSSSIASFTIDLTNPVVYLNYPLNSTITNASYVNYTAFDANIQNCTLYTNVTSWHANKTMAASSNVTQNITMNLQDGNYLWNIQCADKSNRAAFNNTNYTFELDTTRPDITISSLDNKTYSSNTSLKLNLSIYDLNGISTKWYNIDNMQNITISENITFNASVDSHIVNVYASDSIGNEKHSSVSFSIDLTPPEITLISPENNTVKTDSKTVSFSYNASDIAISNCSLSIDNSIDQTDTTISPGIEQTFSKTLENGDHAWNITCMNDANMISSSPQYLISINVSSGSNDDGDSGSSGSGSSGGGGGGGSSGSASSETTPAISSKSNSQISLPVTEQKEPEKKESNEQKTQAPTGNNAAKKENIPLTGRAISLMKSAAKPKPVIMGAFAMLIITYVISVVRSKIKDKDVYP